MKRDTVLLPYPASTASWRGIKSQTEETYTTDNMIDAYKEGLAHGMNYINSKIKKELIEKLSVILPKVESFYRSIPEDAREFMVLQLSSIDYFQVIIALDKNIYFSDIKCKPIYESSSDLCRELNNLNISFIPCRGMDSVNIESLAADGYLMMYKENEG